MINRKKIKMSDDGLLFERFSFGLKETCCTLNLAKSVKLLFYAAAMNLIAYSVFLCYY